MVKIQPDSKAAYELMHEGILALAEIERNGINIDLDYCKKQSSILDKKINRMTERLMDSEDVKEWKKLFGKEFNINSNPQLSKYLFDHKGLKPSKITVKGNASVDEESLKAIDEPFVQDLINIRKLKKTRDTYIGGIIREVSEDGLLHPFFNLHTVITYRSSSDSPNFQNIPVRDPDMKKLIRKAFIPRPRHRIGGIDYSGIEVRIAACYHQDPTMLKYINDPTSDMHRDMAMECYKLKKDQVSKDARYCAKNKFVFPQFYGDWYRSCAENLWGAIASMNLQLVDGTPMKEHLKSVGIKSYQAFEDHIQKVEKRFWYDRFPVYAKWKEKHLKEYEKRGYFYLHTGFKCSGVMKKNDVINYPVQGAAFHCLLWSLTRIHKWMKEQRLRSKIVGQIHDEITMDNHADEMEMVLKESKRIMCEDIRKQWKWIITPLDIEVEFSPVDGTWYEQEVMLV